jgi:hypothetical protein
LPFGVRCKSNALPEGAFFDRAMHHRTVKSQQPSDLVLVQRSAAAQRREDKPAGLRAPGFLFHAPSDMEVGGRQLDKNRVLPDFLRNEFIICEDHRMVTVDSQGRRRCG